MFDPRARTHFTLEALKLRQYYKGQRGDFFLKTLLGALVFSLLLDKRTVPLVLRIEKMAGANLFPPNKRNS